MKNVALVFLVSSVAFAFEPPESAGLLSEYLKRAEQNGFCGSVLVSTGGKILIDQGYGMADKEEKRAQTSETIFSIGSITKQFTAAAIMRLVADGKLNVTDKLSQHFQNVPDDKKDITLHQLLTHTAGFRGALGDDYDTLTADQYSTLAFSSRLMHPPGAEYNYSNVGYSLLGIVIEKTSGMGYERFLRERFFVPAGMMHTGYVIPEFKKSDLAVGYRDGNRWGTALDRPWLTEGPGWHLRANGGILSTTSDMYKWIRALKFALVLPEDGVRQLWTPHVKEGPDEPSFYGYGWAVEDTDKGRLVWHNGGNGVYNAFAGINTDKDLVVIVSSNSNDKISDRVAEHLSAILNGEFRPIDESTSNKFKGTYYLPDKSKFSLRIDENNSLIASFEDPKVAAMMLADGTENEAEMRKVEKRTLEMVNNSRAGKYDLLAQALDAPLEEAADQARMFWENQQAMHGKVKTIDPFVTVARSGRGLTLSFVRITYPKATRYIMYVWKGNNLVDIRPTPNMEKVFDHGDKLTFNAPTNDVSITLSDIPKSPNAAIRLQKQKTINASKSPIHLY